MKKTRFTESQIVKALQENEAGRKTDDICRELGVSRATFYKGKSRYGGMEANELKRLRELEEENARLKKMFADLSLNYEVLKEVITKKAGALAAKAADRGDHLRARPDCRQGLPADGPGPLPVLLQEPQG